MEVQVVDIDNPNHLNFILGQSHFIKVRQSCCWHLFELSSLNL